MRIPVPIFPEKTNPFYFDMVKKKNKKNSGDEKTKETNKRRLEGSVSHLTNMGL
jgi:hypothetical protein